MPINPVYELFKPEHDGDVFELVAFYCDYSTFVQKRAILKVGKSKMRWLITNLVRIESFMADMTQKHLTIYWPWDKHGNDIMLLNKSQGRMILNNLEEMKSWTTH